MQFIRYNSIENSYRQKYIDKIQWELPKDTLWNITEKIHGANFSFVVQDGELRVAKRSGFIKEGEKFFNHHKVINLYSDAILKLALTFYPTNNIRVVGELYGEGVQKGVFYSEEQDFRAFDIFIDGIPISVDHFYMLCTAHDIPCVPSVGTDLTLEEALAIPNEFDSVVGGIKDNLAEGVVIKPMYPQYLSNGSRVILKNKCAKFSEKKKSPAKVTVPLLPEEQQLVDNFMQYINDNRVNSVISKLGEITTKDFGKVLGLTMQDALADYKKDLGDVDKDLWNKVKKVINKLAATVIRETFKREVV